LPSDDLLEAKVRLLELLQILDRAAEHPANLIGFMTGWDERAMRTFQFNMDRPDDDWFWQREFVEWMWDNNRTIVLKARQLGITWLAAGIAAWVLLYHPGSLVLVYRQKEEEASDVVRRIFILLKSLPAEFWRGARIIKPFKEQPYVEVDILHPGGRISHLKGMTSSVSSGHGRSAAFVILDEYAHIEKADDISKAVNSTVGVEGRLTYISTANGRSNEDTGEGNDFHRLYVKAKLNEKEEGSEFETMKWKFLPWFLHPTRNQDWYDNSPETRDLKEHQRMEQYPSTDEEAFAFSQKAFFDKAALVWYARHGIHQPILQGQWKVKRAMRTEAKFHKTPDGVVRIYKKPDPEHRYAIGSDVATGTGMDYSAAYVIDLETMEFVAELHGRVASDLWAEQLHFTGKWYNSALIAVEDAGGWGTPVIIFLRDGRKGRPAYTPVYRHKQLSRFDKLESKPFGFPMNLKTRPVALGHMEEVFREHHLPYITPHLLVEMGNFITDPDKRPSPRASEGSHDDCVMAAAVTLELYRQRGKHEHQFKKEEDTTGYVSPYPWERRRARQVA
jgi:hypothetical protein